MEIKIFILLFIIQEQVLAHNYVYDQINSPSRSNFALRLKCFTKCNKHNDCGYVTIEENECKMYSKSENLEETSLAGLYRKRIDSIQGMVNHWPIMATRVNDIVGGKDLYNSENAFFVENRFGKENSAVRLNLGYYTIPAGQYFGPEFSISIWAKFFDSSRYSRIFEFSNGMRTNNVIGMFTHRNSSIQIGLTIYNYTTAKGLGYSEIREKNRWYHIVYVIKQTSVKIFLDGNLKDEGIGFIIQSDRRAVNYLGQSSWPNYPFSNFTFDDLKIFNRALESHEIKDLKYIYS